MWLGQEGREVREKFFVLSCFETRYKRAHLHCVLFLHARRFATCKLEHSEWLTSLSQASMYLYPLVCALRQVVRLFVHPASGGYVGVEICMRAHAHACAPSGINIFESRRIKNIEHPVTHIMIRALPLALWHRSRKCLEDHDCGVNETETSMRRNIGKMKVIVTKKAMQAAI
jgi:hypothetical protein